MRIHGGLAAAGSALLLCACGMPEATVQPPRDSYSAVSLSVRARDVSETVEGAHVKPEFFTAGNVRPMLGRFLIDGEYAAGATAVAVISHRYWAQRFGSDPAVIGSRIDVNGRPFVIVGIAPTQFQPEGAPMIWIPQVR